VAPRKNALAARPCVEVHLDAPELGPRMQVGLIYPADMRLDLAPSFAYSPQWLASDLRFLLDPRLDLYPGEQHATHTRGFGAR
jgi:serine/threonine-protein kinase HipA